MVGDRTLRMKKEYKNLFDSGMTLHEIADRFGLSTRCIYLHLDDIARENGVSRESLLMHSRVVKTNDVSCNNSVEFNETRPLSEIMISLDTHVNNIIDELKRAIYQIEQINNADL